MTGSAARALAATAALAALLAACAAPDAAADPAPPDLAPAARAFVAVSANLRYGTADDGPDAWPLRRARLARALLAAAPDVLGTQEALDFQDAFVQELLPHHARLGRGRDADGGGERCTLWVDARRFDVEDGGTFWLSPTPVAPGSRGWDAALPRICTWARLRERSSGAVLHVWNAHFDHRGAEARLRAAEQIAARTAALPGPHLLLGDLNAGPDEPPLAALRAAGLRDLLRELHPHLAARGTFHGFRGGTDGARIDFVLANAGLRARDAGVLSAPDADGRWPSDHHFVSATLEVVTDAQEHDRP